MTRTLTSLALLLLAAGAGLYAADDEAGFVALFSGNELTGWHGAVENYELADGVLSCRPEKGGNVYTNDEYADFELRFEFRLTPGANSGIGLRVPDGGHASTQGMEIQIIDDGHPRYAEIKPYQMHGSVYGIIPAERGHLKPVGEWNVETIRCVGRRIAVILNGATIVDGDLDAATQSGTADGREHPGLQRTTGHLCLCTHGSDVDFRNMRVRRLTADAAATQAQPTADRP